MWFKKKQAATHEENGWTLEYKSRWDAATKAMNRLRGQVGETETAVRCLDLYPCGALKTEALKRANAAQEELAIRAKEYHKAVVEVESYYALYWEDIEVDWHPSQWKSEFEVIEFAFNKFIQLSKC